MRATRSGFLLGIFCVMTMMLGYNIGTPICKYGGKLDSSGKCVCPTFNNCSENDSLCGSNGVQYMNECELKEDACRHQKPIFAFKKGICGRSYLSPCSYIFCDSVECPQALVQDSFGCFSKCECRAFQCTSMSSCDLNCDEKGGVVLDNNHCPKCECNE